MICAIVVAYTLVVLNVGSYHSNPCSHLPFSNVYGVALTIAKHPRNGGGRIGGPAEVWYKSQQTSGTNIFISFFRPAVLCYLCMLLLSLPPFYLGIPCLTYCFCCPCCRVDPLTRFNLWAARAMEGGIWYTNMVLEHKKNVAAHSTDHRQGTAGDTTQKNKSRGKKAPVIEV